MSRYLILLIAAMGAVQCVPCAAGAITDCELYGGQGEVISKTREAKETSGGLVVTFEDDSSAKFTAEHGAGFTVYRLDAMDLKTSAAGMKVFKLNAPKGAELAHTLNGYYHEGRARALMSADAELLAQYSQSGANLADKAGCSHVIKQTTQSREGKFAAEFWAKSAQAGGWAMTGVALEQPVALKDLAGLSAWIYGDGRGESLKFQMSDGAGGARDFYVPVTFTGWKHVKMTDAALDTMKGDHMSWLNLYYNGLPEGEVRCVVDEVGAIVVEGGTTSTRLVESFESGNRPWFSGNDERNFRLNLDFKYAGVGIKFGVIDCPAGEFMDTIERFEKGAGILSPHPGGEWNKRAQVTKESYLFLTSFSAKQFDEALALAKQGGFRHVLLGQESWCKSTGHYEVNTNHFPGGLPELVATAKRFREAGITVGLHVLGASIDWNDPYLTPKPDPRLVKDARTTLSAALDASSTTIVLESMPELFPAEDGGYNGLGTVVQIGDELITYAARTTTAPYTLSGCKRGHLGTTATAHGAGESVAHLPRPYGYHLHDMDTTLLDEVTANFARVANACDVDMVYFDGSERLQGDHGRYNARLINAFLEKLNRKDILVQASSFSHYSWHQLARSASADGHGDLKGYLEERSPSFAHFRSNGMPLDIGWYYGYDPKATPDQFEYILGTTIGYDSSFSFQVSVDAAKKHPFTGEFLDLIREYDELRLKGKVDEAMRERLRVVKELQGKAPEDKTRQNELRRDYHLVDGAGGRAFQRMVYGEWQDVKGLAADGFEWEVSITTGPASLGFQVQNLAKAGEAAALRNPAVSIEGAEPWKIEGELGPTDYAVFEPGEKPMLYSAALTEPRRSGEKKLINSHEGKYKLKLSADEATTGALRVRAYWTVPENYPLEK